MSVSTHPSRAFPPRPTSALSGPCHSPSRSRPRCGRSARLPRRRSPVRAQVMSGVSPVELRGIRIGARLQQRLHHRRVCVGACERERRDAIVVRGVRIGPGANQRVRRYSHRSRNAAQWSAVAPSASGVFTSTCCVRSARIDSDSCSLDCLSPSRRSPRRLRHWPRRWQPKATGPSFPRSPGV